MKINPKSMKTSSNVQMIKEFVTMTKVSVKVQQSRVHTNEVMEMKFFLSK